MFVLQQFYSSTTEAEPHLVWSSLVLPSPFQYQTKHWVLRACSTAPSVPIVRVISNPRFYLEIELDLFQCKFYNQRTSRTTVTFCFLASTTSNLNITMLNTLPEDLLLLIVHFMDVESALSLLQVAIHNPCRHEMFLTSNCRLAGPYMRSQTQSHSGWS